MNREIYFRDLPELTQIRILDEYGASCPAELGLDAVPYATIVADGDGVAALCIANVKSA